MKTRLQIQLDREDYEALRAWATSSGISMSGAVRLLIREKLTRNADREKAVARFLSVAGAVKERPGDEEVSREHDRVLHGTGEARE